jgi:hypothetical protein
MTNEERARKLQWAFYHGTGGDESELQFIARFLRELTEEVHEACAKMLEEEAMHSKELAEHCRKTERWDTAGAAGATAKKLLKMAEKIRARTTDGG